MIAKRQQEREGEKIEAIVVEGNVTIPTAAILQKLKTQAGRKATPAQIQEDLRTLLAHAVVFHRRTEVPPHR